ncbi:putative quinol monooxygenase [Bradyrhizobium erythrophlei]|uniref:putative quinol monooxygenase n=1 Tax=Bradyrhizobium erythrophlei TaxID=1437360 RepID=UPI0035EBF664
MSRSASPSRRTAVTPESSGAASPAAGQPSDSVAIVVILPVKAEARDRFRKMLFAVVEAMVKEPDFVNTWVHEDLNDPDTLVLYETWACSSEHLLEHHLKKPYRQAYEAALPEMLKAERRIVFLKPAMAVYPKQRA